MGTRYNPKSYRRSTTSRKQAVDTLRSTIRNSTQNRARKGYSSTPRTTGALTTGEMKYFDCERVLTNITPVGVTWPAGTMFDPSSTINLGSGPVIAPLCLMCPTVGSALNQRVGRKINVYKIRINGTYSTAPQGAQTSADVATKVRLTLVLDKQSNGTQMTAAQLFNGSSSADCTINAFQNPDNFGRFQILKDKFMVLQNPSLAGAAPATIDQAGLKTAFKMTVTFKTPIQVNFNNVNGGTVADIIDNSFHLICSADVTAMGGQLAYYSRCCYKE